MTFTVEVLLKGQDMVAVRHVEVEGPEPLAWADDDVRRVLELTLGAFDAVQQPEGAARTSRDAHRLQLDRQPGGRGRCHLHRDSERRGGGGSLQRPTSTR